jgi:ribA/ribD-fused uncharacterized protein
MTTGRNPILIGQAEEFDLVLPQVRAMIENEGVYICGDTVHPAFTVPLVSYDGKILSLVAEAELDPERFIPSFTAHGPYLASTHPDDFAVDRFAAALKAKLAKKRAEGMSGWDDKTACPEERLQTMLVEHLDKGDPVDVGNFAMMLFNRGESCAAPAPASAEVPMPERPVGFIKPDTDTCVYFYEQDFYVLSNFSAFSLVWKGRTFPTSEHAYHWEKFSGGDAEYSIRYCIRHAPSAHEAFKIAERCKRDRRPEWDEVKVDTMREILRAKVEQHEYVRRKLLATGDRELIEDSWRDDFWGWGPNRNGKNMLGKLWMEIRADLRHEAQP